MTYTFIRKPLLKGTLSTVDLLFKITCFVNKKKEIFILKAADLS